MLHENLVQIDPGQIKSKPQEPESKQVIGQQHQRESPMPIRKVGDDDEASDTSQSQASALIVSFSTTKNVDQFRKMAEMASDVLSQSRSSITDTLVKSGALIVVASRLMRAMHNQSHSEEAPLVCDVMRLLLRCDQEYTKDFLLRMGIPLVSELIYFVQTSVEPSVDQEKLHLLLFRLASLPWWSLPEKKYSTLVRLLHGTVRKPSSRQVCATSLHFLSELADDTKQKRYIVDYPGLVDDVLEQVVGLSWCGHTDACKAIALFSCRLLRRLAWGTTNRATLARNKRWNQVLFELTRNEDLMIQEEAFEAILQMSTESRSRQSITSVQDAAILKHIVKSLHHTKFASIAAHTLCRLIDSNSAKRLASYQGIFHRLSQLAMQETTTVGIKAAHILKRVACHISIRDRGHDELLDALLCCAGSPRRLVRSWAARGLLAQSESSTNAFYITRSQPVLDVLISLATDADPLVRKSAVQTLYNAASDASNTRRAAATTRYLNAFVSNAMRFIKDADKESIATSRLSIRGILKLSDHAKSFNRVAKQKGAIESLARYGVSSDSDQELKGAALHAVVLLSPFI